MEKNDNNMLLFLVYGGFDMLMAYIIFGNLNIPAVFTLYAKIAIIVATIIFVIAFIVNNHEAKS